MGEWAKKAGHSVVHWSFKSHNTKFVPKEDVIILPQYELESADPFCAIAAKAINRHWKPKSEFVANLLRRNWFQVCYSDSCYAVSSFNLPLDTRFDIGDIIKGDAEIGGGTAWAVQFFLDLHHQEKCDCYVFDQKLCYWFKWERRWTRIYQPPTPSGVWAGIGARDLITAGRLAIRTLFDQKLNT